MARSQLDPLSDAYSLVLEAEDKLKREPGPENEKSFGKAKWALHTLIKQNIEILNYYANGGTDGGQIAKQFMGGQVKVKPPCKNCGGKS